jgi:hypothetical protein
MARRFRVPGGVVPGRSRHDLAIVPVWRYRHEHNAEIDVEVRCSRERRARQILLHVGPFRLKVGRKSRKVLGLKGCQLSADDGQKGLKIRSTGGSAPQGLTHTRAAW